MLTYKVFRYRIYPTHEQGARLRQWEAAQRCLWNLAHEQRLMALARPKGEAPCITAPYQQLQLKSLRAEYDWIARVPHDLQATLLDELDRAWQLCFRRLAARPRFKSNGRSRVPLYHTDKRKQWIRGGKFWFPKLGLIRIKLHRPLEGERRICSLVRDVDQWFVAITCQVELPDHKPRVEPRVGLDRGVTNIIADSEGRLIVNPRNLRRSARQLTRADRALSRKKIGSKNREKARIRLAKLHRRVRRQRDHLLHGLSCHYAKSHGTVVVEKLRVQNMTRGASGTKTATAWNAKRKTGLNRAILDAGWNRFARMLNYKLRWSGGQLVEVPPEYSSQTCAQCGHVDAASRATQARFVCTKCGHKDHADVNAAKVILSRGSHGEAVCGGSAHGRPTKQKLCVARRAACRSVKSRKAATP